MNDLRQTAHKRKPLSKRVRFDIFKRDGFACQYCGAHPPSVVLEVDHIVPVAAGGGNGADNLVASCFNCNRGKSAVALNVVPQSLAEKAAETAEREAQIAGYTAILDARRDRIEADVWRVVEHWTGEEKTSDKTFNAIARFIELIGVHSVLDAVDIVRGKGLAGRREFMYFCKVCWNKAGLHE